MMSLFKNKYRIESARLKGYNYSSPGEYFITIDTKSMVEWFGRVENGVMVRNDIGEMVRQLWLTIPQHHNNVTLDEFIVMPNHIHGILALLQYPCKDVARDVSTRNKNNFMSSISPKCGSLSKIIGSHKSALTNWCHKQGHDDFQWQPRFHDHIIRSQQELDHIREYIRDNPGRWQEEKNSPSGLADWLD
jgi:putative transposase